MVPVWSNVETCYWHKHILTNNDMEMKPLTNKSMNSLSPPATLLYF